MRESLFAIALLIAAPALANAQPTESDESEPESTENAPPPARARPTSGEASLSSGRTLGVGEVMIAGAVGWPWIWAQLELAPTSSFNIGLRAALVYGSPVMSLQPGVGGEVAIPMRIHLMGEGDFDLAAYITPAFTAGEAAIVGQSTTLRGAFGWGSRLEFGGLVGFHVMERLTIIAGLGGVVGFVHTPDEGNVYAVGGLTARFGVEGLISRDTMLFAIADGGVGFADDRSIPLFSPGLTDAVLRISLGVAYLL